MNKDTRLCISLAGRPSNIGTRFHNYLYDAARPRLHLQGVHHHRHRRRDRRGARARHSRLFGVDAVQEDVIALVDEVEPSARAIHSVNTIVNDDGHLTASNTDYIAVQRLIDEHGLDPTTAVLIRGSGGMASAVGAAFRDNGFHAGIDRRPQPEAGARWPTGSATTMRREVGSTHSRR